jgi:hypothetical protein
MAASVRECRDPQQVRLWWEQWQTHPNSDFAHFELVCRQRRDVVVTPLILVAEHEGNPQALLIARLERTRFAPRIGYVSAVRVPVKGLSFIYEGSLGKIDDSLIAGFAKHIWSLLASRNADIVEVHHLRGDSPLGAALKSSAPRGWCVSEEEPRTHRSMSLPVGTDFLTARFNAKHRSAIKRKQRGLEAEFPGRVVWRWLKQFDDIPGLCQRIEQVAALTYQRALGAGFTDNAEHRERLALFASSDRLRVQLLEIDGQVRAFWVGCIYQGVFHSWETGYDPALRSHEVGTLVFVRMIDELIQEGIEKLDFGLGDAQYKQRFGDGEWTERTLRLFAPTVQGFFLSRLGALFQGAERVARKVAERTGAVDKIRTAWRRRLSR